MMSQLSAGNAESVALKPRAAEEDDSYYNTYYKKVYDADASKQ